MRKIRIPGFESAEGGLCPYCGLEMSLHNKLYMEEKGHEFACIILLKAIIKDISEKQLKTQEELERTKKELSSSKSLEDYLDKFSPKTPGPFSSSPGLPDPTLFYGGWETPDGVDNRYRILRAPNITWRNVVEYSTKESF